MRSIATTIDDLSERLDANLAFLSEAPCTEATQLGQGFNSVAVRVDDTVIKVGKQLLSANQVDRTLGCYRAEFGAQAGFVGDHMPATDYIITRSLMAPDHARLVTKQPFVPGLTVAEHLAKPEADISHLINFLGDCLNMYHHRGQIPDLANVETGFNVFRNSNVVMNGDQPVLVDVNYGKIQRSRSLGRVWSWAIADGVSRGIRQLVDGSYQSAVEKRSFIDRAKDKLPAFRNIGPM